MVAWGFRGGAVGNEFLGNDEMFLGVKYWAFEYEF